MIVPGGMIMQFLIMKRDCGLLFSMIMGMEMKGIGDRGRLAWLLAELSLQICIQRF